MSCDCPDTRVRLNDANTAYHNMQTGQQAQTITTGGETVSYAVSRNGASDLKKYITELHANLAACPICKNTASQARTGARRAFKPAFGG